MAEWKIEQLHETDANYVPKRVLQDGEGRMKANKSSFMEFLEFLCQLRRGGQIENANSRLTNSSRAAALASESSSANVSSVTRLSSAPSAVKLEISVSVF